MTFYLPSLVHFFVWCLTDAIFLWSLYTWNKSSQHLQDANCSPPGWQSKKQLANLTFRFVPYVQCWFGFMFVYPFAFFHFHSMLSWNSKIPFSSYYLICSSVRDWGICLYLVCVNVCAYIYVCVCVCVCVRVYIYVCVNISVCIYMRMCIVCVCLLSSIFSFGVSQMPLFFDLFVLEIRAANTCVMLTAPLHVGNQRSNWRSWHSDLSSMSNVDLDLGLSFFMGRILCWWGVAARTCSRLLAAFLCNCLLSRKLFK